MCSTLGLDHRKLQLTNSNNISSKDDIVEWCTRLLFVTHLAAYLALLVLLATMVFMIFKLLSDVDGEAGATETEPLRPRKTVTPLTYGTCGEDIERGNCSASSSSSNNSNCATSEDLYDGKVCVICYDEQRNCFFVPCGHCATCYDCAKRIFYVETKTCPLCRRCIRKVRKLFAV
ncbi:hypothetical protein FNV43_RR18488 [Rhamnella rubrinervis]|uniref:RING-type domain-containing protein n=1 Tax=Rhamnella rubrinervis TaxID=2594499 RepID=A0A8K0E6C8_9ROSA|nr:hypothetical protein FNV43_RR17106 [Rhamnella rubrinervis]KAF3440205.1 hypothetical protein FNV43_RR18488 [Rhamnella rubrinervis]